MQTTENMQGGSEVKNLVNFIFTKFLCKINDKLYISVVVV